MPGVVSEEWRQVPCYCALDMDEKASLTVKMVLAAETKDKRLTTKISYDIQTLSDTEKARRILKTLNAQRNSHT